MNKIKNFILFLALFFTATIMFTSCGSDDPIDPNPTCTDGILNQDETGVDCGGVCLACPSCTDGIQNQDETGVDCGGSCDLCVVSDCSDGLMNGDETGIDCGGSCDPCVGSTCGDGVQNGGETGIDCGGSCNPCIGSDCSDGIQNGDETGIDCGGSCAGCSTANCSDGIQNGDETGIDCGGSCDPCNLAFSEHITCNINGVPFAANLVSGFDNSTTLEFQSDQSQERQLFFVLPSGIEAGTYNLFDNPGFSARYAKLFDGEFTTETGSMTISSNNTAQSELSGTFEFSAVEYSFGTAVDTVYVTNGSFGVEYF